MKLTTAIIHVKGGEQMKISESIEKIPWNKRLIIARTIAGLNQKEAADKIGTTQKMVWLWETGKIIPRESSRKRIANAYGVNYEELFDGLLPK